MKCIKCNRTGLEGNYCPICGEALIGETKATKQNGRTTESRYQTRTASKTRSDRSAYRTSRGSKSIRRSLSKSQWNKKLYLPFIVIFIVNLLAVSGVAALLALL